MATRRLQGVQFNGEAASLHSLLGCYNAIKGMQWKVTATDYVGGCFDVTFSRKGGPISKAEVQAWIDAALKHAR